MTGDPNNPYEGKVYNSDGSLAGTIGTGHIINMGVDSSGKAMFFFVGNDNDTGQLFSTNAGLTGYSGYTWTGTLNPTTTQVNTFAVSYGSTTPLAAGQTATQNTAPTITGTSTSYTYRNVVSGNTTTVYRTPVTTTTYSDGTTSTSNGTESLYQTKVASNVVTNKIVNGVLTVYTTPIFTVTDANGNKTIEANGAVTTTTQNVSQGLRYQTWRYDPKNYNCFLGICAWNFTYHAPSTNINNYGNPVTSGITNSGMFLATNGRLPNGDNSWIGYNDGTVIRYTGTITAPITQNYPAGTVYRLYFYNQTDDGFVLKINGSQIINNPATYQFQAIGGNYNGSGWIDVVAGQSYNLEAWYWNTDGGVGHRFFWNYGAGILMVPNSAFSTGWITETNTVDTTGTVYSNSAVVDVTGTSFSMYPDYVTIGGGTPGDMVFGTVGSITTDQQTKVDTWTNKTIQDGNVIYIQQIGGTDNTVTMDQDGNKNLITLQLQGTNNNITARQGVQGIGQNEMKLNIEGNNNVVNLNQARDTQGNPVGGNGHYLDATIAGWGTSLTVQQTNNGGVGGHYNETTIYGNGNNVIAKQLDNGNKIMFLKVDGALNTVDVTQKGTGQHKLDATLTGDRNSVTALQEGNTANNATLNLTNNGGPASVILQQNGGQSVNVTTSCSTTGGCAPITVRQGY
jgi:hypothetical protein